MAPTLYNYTFTEHTDPQAFLAETRDMLLKNEAVNNQTLGFLAGQPDPADVHRLTTIKLHGKCLGCALIPRADQPLQLSPMPKNAAADLAAYLEKHNVTLNGVLGPEKTIGHFLKAWSAASDSTTSPAIELAINLGVFTTSKITPQAHEKSAALGMGLVATPGQRDVLTAFCHGFMADCFPNENNRTEKAAQLAQMHLSNQTALLWQTPEGEIVSVAAKQRQTPNMAAISLVYTPPEHRGKGYAAAAVTTLSQILLDASNKKCVLFADLNNPFTPDFYRKIGYSHIETMPRYVFNHICF